MLRSGGDASLRVLLLPHSGAGPTALRPLAGLLAPDVEVRGLCLPGRERRAMERADARVDDVVDAWSAAGLDDGVPTVLVGHSLGALLAVHVASAAEGSCRSVVLSGHRPAALDGRPAGSPVTEQDVDDLLAAGGTPAAVLAEPDLRAMLEAALRADVRLGREAGERVGDVRLTVPVFTLAGDVDPFASPATMRQWRRHTTGAVLPTTLPGGHFALLDEENRPAVGDVLRGATADR